jgi:hypothetical protein
MEGLCRRQAFTPPPAYVTADLTKGFYNERDWANVAPLNICVDGEHVVVVVVGLRGVVAERILN